MLDNISFIYKKLIKKVFNSSLIEEEDINKSLEELSMLKGTMAVSLIDWENSIILGTKTKTDFNIERASKGNSKVIRAYMKMLSKLNISSPVDDILITLSNQIHIMHIISAYPQLCIYIALDSNKSNLALSRTKAKEVGEALSSKYEAVVKKEN